MPTTPTKHGAHRGTFFTIAIAIAAALLALSPVGADAASTRIFSPGVVKQSSVVFPLHGLDAATVHSAAVEVNGHARPISRAKVLRGAQIQRLTVTVKRAKKVRNRIKLRVVVHQPRQPQTGEGSGGESTSVAPAKSVSSSQPSPAKPVPTPSPTPAPVPAPTPPESEPSPVIPSGPSSSYAAQPVTIPSNARYVSADSGSDANAGSATAPWKTLNKAIASANPGDVVVLEPGTYGAPGVTTTFGRSGSTAAPIVFTSDPGKEAAVIRGYVRVTGSHLRLDSLLFDGPTGPVAAKTSENPNGEEVQVSIMYGSDVDLTRNEVRDNAWHAGVFVSNATDVNVVSNYIHDNGDVATGANLDHGVYWCSGSGVVANNVIEDNIAWGVHLYPYASNVLVARNLITGNGKGGVIVARESANNEVVNNTVTDNGGYGIRAYSLTGEGNVARDNLLWQNGENVNGSGMTFSGSIIADPDGLTSVQRASYQP